MEHLKNYFKEQKITFPREKIYSEFEFDAAQGWEGNIFPRPGGLMKNLLVHDPEMEITTSEGPGQLYEELDSYLKQNSDSLPTVFDVLNCEYGCNGGPAIGKSVSVL